MGHSKKSYSNGLKSLKPKTECLPECDLECHLEHHPEHHPECHPECQDQLDMVRSHTTRLGVDKDKPKGWFKNSF